MDGSKKVMESLDSLWFFDNVLSLPSFQHNVYEDTVQEEEESKPKIQDAEILVPRCPKCGEIEQQPMTEVEFAKPPEKSKRRRRRRRRSKRKVLGELHLGFHGKLASESSFSEENVAHPNFETPHYTKMPPLNDGLAMKEHLKSWAHAVACRVK
ncbi:hypothetical protein HRI_000958000 [Hibiscus trionum]|uniref:Uncharacterized protein n=1 Tax=Hibiscus trionum TaxID=183268 RepID=A0A9W7LPY6_HIBTR|nr:hypothetical protein HRI_000958000 [Hibiscus trionum]